MPAQQPEPSRGVVVYMTVDSQGASQGRILEVWVRRLAAGGCDLTLREPFGAGGEFTGRLTPDEMAKLIEALTLGAGAR